MEQCFWREEEEREGEGRIESVCILIHTVHWYMATCTYHELIHVCHQKGHAFIPCTCMEIVACTYNIMHGSHGYRPSPVLMLYI